jgi:hypothetical protein
MAGAAFRGCPAGPDADRERLRNMDHDESLFKVEARFDQSRPEVAKVALMVGP